MELTERIINNDENQIIYLSGEDWKPFGNYLVSNYGRVYSLYKNRMINPILKKSCIKHYYWVRLYDSGTYKCYAVHRLVAMLFIPNEQEKEQVHHIDCNTLNNRADNLMWVTQAEHNEIHRKLKEKEVKCV